MNHELTLIIVQDQRHLWARVMEQVQDRIVTLWGGYSMYEGQGAWRDPKTGDISYENHFRLVVDIYDWQPHNIWLECRELVDVLSAVQSDEDCFYFNLRESGRTRLLHPRN